jgi:pimeloyl-ACP methyl ester carboxylesterase
MPFADLSTGVRIHYLDPNPSGGQAVLLLHGLGATGESWALQFPPLTEAGFRPIAPDARGFGKSSYPGGKLTIDVFSRDMAELLETLGVASAHVVGISMGGTVALQLALDHPKPVRKLVLVNTFASLQPKGLGGRIYFLVRMLTVHTLGVPTQAKMVAKKLFPRPEQEQLRRDLIAQIEQANPKAYRAALSALSRFDVVDRLPEISAPTLVITGSEDTTVPLENQRILAERIPGARQTTIHGAGHAVIADSPEAFNEALISFLT